MTVANFTESHWSSPIKWLFRFITAYLFMRIPSTFQYEKKGNYQLTIKGVLISQAANDTLNIRLQRKNLTDFLLLNRDFNWVNEYPFNR